MSKSEFEGTVAGPSAWSMSGEAATEQLRRHRHQLRAYAAIPTDPDAGQQEAALRSAPRLTLEELPGDIQELVRRYESAQPGVRLRLLQYLTITAEPDERAAEGIEELPDDDSLVTLVITETMLGADVVEVRSRMLIAVPSSEG